VARVREKNCETWRREAWSREAWSREAWSVKPWKVKREIEQQISRAAEQWNVVAGL